MNTFWKFSLMLFMGLLSINVSAQVDSVWKQESTLAISGYLDVFYVFDFNEPQGTSRQDFLYNHNRHNEFNLNLGFLKFAVDHAKYRSSLALQTGTYSNDNYVSEPGLLKNIFEANVGLSLNKKNTLWIDAGIFASHIGFESAVSMDNWTMTRSLLAENSPYFLAGAKLTYSPNNQMEIAGLLVNGWQRIQRVEGNSMPSFGTQVRHTFSDRIKWNWSTFIGTDDPDSTRRMRYFNNLYGQFQVSKKIQMIAGFDIGAQQRTKGSAAYDIWLTPAVIAQYMISDTWKLATRLEYFQDKRGIIIPRITRNGFMTTGVSLNLDYIPSSNIICRLEGRWMNSKDRIMESKSGLTDNNMIVAASIAIKFLSKPI